jgi:hypothetical protein
MLDGRVLPGRPGPPWTDDERDPGDGRGTRVPIPDGGGQVVSRSPVGPSPSRDRSEGWPIRGESGSGDSRSVVGAQGERANRVVMRQPVGTERSLGTAGNAAEEPPTLAVHPALRMPKVNAEGSPVGQVGVSS